MRHRILLTVIAITAALSLLAADHPRETKLQQAIELMGTKGDLLGAAKLLEDVAKSTDRNLAARGLLYLGDCREKLGQKESRTSWERIVRDFADQKEVVTEASRRLAAAGGVAVGMTYRQVWSGPKAISDGIISADGRYLPYTDWETGDGDLALHDFTDGSDRHLTNKGTWLQSEEYAEESVISRDGKQVAYAWSNGKDHYSLRTAIIPASGFVQPRQLFDSPDGTFMMPYDWSPDGKWISVELSRKDRTEQSALLSVRDGSLRELRSVASYGLAFSPDSRYVAATYDAGTGREIVVLPVAGGAEVKAVTGPAKNIMMGWSPDGKRLVFGSDRSGSMALWAVLMAEGKPAGVPEMIRSEIPKSSLGVTASGSLYVGETLGIRDIQVASLDFSTGKLLSPPFAPIQSFPGSNQQPDWSPDGKSLAYISVRTETKERVLAIRSMETGDTRELRPRNITMFNNTRWMPDGRSLVFQGTSQDGRQGIYRIDAVTGEMTPIVLGPAAERAFSRPRPSQDGKRVFYFKRLQPTGDDYGVTERDLSSGDERELIRGKLGAPASISPNGRYVATLVGGSGKAGFINLTPIDGGPARELFHMDAPENLIAIDWMPDSRGLLARKATAHTELWLVPIDGSQPRKMEVKPGRASTSLSVNPDGHQLAYFGDLRKDEVWVLENFLPGAKAVATTK